MFVIENNLYGEYSPVRQTTPMDDLVERAQGHAMPGVIVDGQDVEAVYEVVADAIGRARLGDGPTLIEAKTYRFRGHSRTDPGGTAWMGSSSVGNSATRSTCSEPGSRPTGF